MCYNTSAQNKLRFKNSSDKTGIAMLLGGVVISTIAISIPDGTEWTYANTGPNTQHMVYTPFFKQPARVGMLVVGVTFSITGLFYIKNNK